MSRVVPENYRHLAREAIDAGRFERAISIVETRISREWYDFAAHYLLAEAQSGAGLYESAADTMKSVLVKSLAIRGRVRPDQAGYSGFDEARTLQLLGRYLWLAGRHLSAAEVWRVALDTGSSVALEDLRNIAPPDSRMESGQILAAGIVGLRLGDGDKVDQAASILMVRPPPQSDFGAYLQARGLVEIEKEPARALEVLRSRVIASPQQPIPRAMLESLATTLSGLDPTTSQALSLEPGSAAPRRASLDKFILPQGARLEQGRIVMTRRGVLKGTFDTGMFPAEYILLSVRGSSAFGLWPVLVLSANGQEVGRIYADCEKDDFRVVGPFKGGLPKSLGIDLEFINDSFDPVTRADRDVFISGVWFL